MKMRTTLIALGVATILSGCSQIMSMTGYGYTDQQIQLMSTESCIQMDKEAKLAPANSKYTKRLNRIARKLASDVNGVPLNYKVYIAKDINAFAMPNGCVRVYSGLMDLMTDDEVMGVVGHEIGHVALGHTKERFQVQGAAMMARDVAGMVGGKVAELSASEYADLAHAVIGGQFSQANESEADDYSFDLLTQRNLNRKGLITAFEKLASLDVGTKENKGIVNNVLGGLTGSHPDALARANHLRDRLNSGK